MTSFRYLLLAFWIILVGCISGCNETPEPDLTILQIDGVLWGCNVNTSYGFFGASAEDEENPELCIPVSDGDLLYFLHDDWQIYYRYEQEHGEQLSVSFDTLNAISVYLNGTLSYMELSNPASLEAFKRLSEAEIAGLSSLFIDMALTDDLISKLKEHETSLQGTGLILENNNSNARLQDLLSILRPGYLVMDDSWILPDPEKHLSLSSLELLWIQGNVSALAKLARCCSNLESLIIADWEPEQGELMPLSSLKSLRSLTIGESGITTLSNLEFPESLKHFYLIACDTLSDISGLTELNRLTRLGLSYCTQIQGKEIIQEFQQLQWLSLPSNTSQEDLSELSGRLQMLEVVELNDCPEIKDLSPLQALPELKILLLNLEPEQLDGLTSLKQLELVLLTSEIFEDNTQLISELRASLPDTEIMPGSGICLGSGWLLLLLPLILLFRFLLRSKS
jgi:hypothetical protein